MGPLWKVSGVLAAPKAGREGPHGPSPPFGDPAVPTPLRHGFSAALGAEEGGGGKGARGWQAVPLGTKRPDRPPKRHLGKEPSGPWRAAAFLLALFFRRWTGLGAAWLPHSKRGQKLRSIPGGRRMSGAVLRRPGNPERRKGGDPLTGRGAPRARGGRPHGCPVRSPMRRKEAPGQLARKAGAALAPPLNLQRACSVLGA